MTNTLSDKLPRDPEEFLKYCRSLNYQQLIDLQIDLSLTITNIQVQQTMHVYDRGEEWRNKTDAALRHYKWRRTTAQQLAACIRAKATRFQEAAAQILPPELYQELCCRADAGAEYQV